MRTIRGIVVVYTSARDRNGNCYHSAQYTDCATGAVAYFRDIGGPSNMNGLAHLLGFSDHDYDSLFTDQQVLPIREYQRLTRDWPYVSNGADTLMVQAIARAIREVENS